MARNKAFTVINITGLALGIAACLLISMYIRDELSYDKAYPDHESIYRVIGQFDNGEKVMKGVALPAPTGNVLKSEFPEVVAAGRLMPTSLFWGAGSNYLRRADQAQNTFEQGFAYADQELLDILGAQLTYGDRAHALSEPRSMVISKRMADKYFPGQDPVGKVMYLNDATDKAFHVGGVMAEPNGKSHLGYDFLLTLAGQEFWKGEQTDWGASNYIVYLKLRPGTDVASFNARMSTTVVRKYVLPFMVANGEKDPEAAAKGATLYLQPVEDIHLRSAGIMDMSTHGDIRFVWLFSIVAFFILLIACINFVNLSTAKSANRAREVGIRKVVGSARGSLIRQFLAESMVFSIFSIALGLFLAWALLPYFNSIAAKDLSIPWQAVWFLPVMLASALLIGLLAGMYPAFYLSAFRPIEVLKGKLSSGMRRSSLRNGLVVFQFTVSIILIVGTIVIYSQMRYILNKKLGFDKDQVVMVEGTDLLHDQVGTFKEELKKLSFVQQVSVSDYLPVAGTKRNGNEFWVEGRTKLDPGTGNSQLWQVDESYLATMGLKLKEGRNFSRELASDSEAVIINQALATQLHLKEPIGKRITNGGDLFTVVGVVEDFHFESMRENIRGLAMHFGQSASVVSMRVKSADMAQVIPALTEVWKKFAPAQPIRYAFLDQRFADMYADVSRTGKLFTGFAVLAIFIACLGLFALSTYMAEQRRKEIGVRKVLGASSAGITAMLSKDFIRLVGISFVIASPIAWWAMNKWLQDFTYRISIGWWVFALAAILAAVIALLTVSMQAVKAARANPVKSLRSE